MKVKDFLSKLDSYVEITIIRKDDNKEIDILFDDLISEFKEENTLNDCEIKKIQSMGNDEFWIFV